MLYRIESIKQRHDSLIESFEGNNIACYLAEKLSNIDFENDIICELDIDGFIEQLSLYVEEPKVNTFYAMGIDLFGQFKKIDFGETPDYFVETRPTSKYAKILQRELAARQNYPVLILLYPSLLPYEHEIKSHKTYIKEMDEEFDQNFGNIDSYHEVYWEAKELVDLCNRHLNTPYGKDSISAWCELNEYLGKEILFGVKKTTGLNGSIARIRHINYFQISSKFAGIMESLSCNDNELVVVKDRSKAWLSERETEEFLRNYYSSFSNNFKQRIFKKIEQDEEECNYDYADSILMYIDYLNYNPSQLTLKERCELNKVTLFDVYRLADEYMWREKRLLANSIEAGGAD